MAGNCTGHRYYVGEVLDTHQGSGVSQVTPWGVFNGHYVGVSRHLLMADSFSEHYVRVTRYTPSAGSFTGHYVGEVLDTY